MMPKMIYLLVLFLCTDTIFVRVYESRMDLLRAVIIGPAGTPYHDGLFFFDILFPPEYPRVPPVRVVISKHLVKVWFSRIYLPM